MKEMERRFHEEADRKARRGPAQQDMATVEDAAAVVDGLRPETAKALQQARRALNPTVDCVKAICIELACLRVAIERKT